MDTLSRKQRSVRMSLIRSKDTGPELRVRRLVHALGYRYRLHVRDLPGSPDLVLPRHRKIIFVHGCFWHRHVCPHGKRMPKSRLGYWRSKLMHNAARDVTVLRKLRRDGWRVLILWECQTRQQERLSRRIVQFLCGPAAYNETKVFGMRDPGCVVRANRR
jgi:DNA mismatch endonuclease (patch repair protein)